MLMYSPGVGVLSMEAGGYSEILLNNLGCSGTKRCSICKFWSKLVQDVFGLSESILEMAVVVRTPSGYGPGIFMNVMK